MKLDALREELRLLDEQLAARKKLADQEDKAAKLAQLEAQLARISADPTRKKEELKLREEISKLREEIAWDIADAEVESQKQSLEDQISSIEDYMAYVERYYEEMLANPRKLLEEFQALLLKADDEIMAWLVQNSEDYATATDAAREDMIHGWQEMLDDMNGAIRTYWDEVEQIIAQGDDAIIAFLRENSEEYRQAGELQAQKYVDEWKKQLEELKNAYKQVAAEINNTPIKPPSAPTTTGSSGSSGGGGGGSGGGSGGGATKYQYGYKNNKGSWVSATSSTSQATAFSNALTAAKSHWQQFIGQPGVAEVFKLLNAATMSSPGSYLKKYLKGGLATTTGLAWLDGSTSKPERILSPHQTELFEDMVKSLQVMKTLRVPSSMPMQFQPAQDARMLTIEEINVNVERLETDDDYDVIARKVGERIYSEIVKGTPVGGLRLQ